MTTTLKPKALKKIVKDSSPSHLRQKIAYLESRGWRQVGTEQEYDYEYYAVMQFGRGNDVRVKVKGMG